MGQMSQIQFFIKDGQKFLKGQYGSTHFVPDSNF